MSRLAPDLDPTLLASRLRLAVTRLNRRLRRQDDTRLSPSVQSALATLARHGPLSLGELAAHEALRPPTVTGIVSDLEARSLVARDPDPHDRRVVRVTVTPAGRALLERSRRRKTEYLAARLRRLDEDRLRALEDAVEVLELLAEEDR
ncbi:MAG TPA: MarR family transcriptional regulator [Candidatus Dormibacteraeota bacterium]|nr:MarR family transcriptional regulator [Candidatus Dormibacteraeota bacterium]